MGGVILLCIAIATLVIMLCHKWKKKKQDRYNTTQQVPPMTQQQNPETATYTLSVLVLFMIIFMIIKYHCYRPVMEETSFNESGHSADPLIKVKKNFKLISN